MINFYDIQDVISQWDSLSTAQIALIVAFYIVHMSAFVFVVRTVVSFISRKTGLSHPTHYNKWPRVPWRSVYKVWSAITTFHERVFQIGQRRTAGFAGVLSVLTMIFKSGMLHLGRSYAFGFGLLQNVGIKPNKHIFIVASTGAGKTNALITMLSTWTNSVFLIDPKGQITYALALLDWRTWYVIDPYHITPFQSACFNVFDCIVEAVKRGVKMQQYCGHHEFLMVWFQRPQVLAVHISTMWQGRVYRALFSMFTHHIPKKTGTCPLSGH